VFNAFADGGKVNMPLGETQWAETFGMVVDRFGTPWGINGGMKPRSQG
jgi:PhnB protein